MPRVIENSTGEIVDGDEYLDIDTAEQELFRSIEDESVSKVHQVRVLIQVRDRQLYRQRLTDDGVAFSSFHEYLRAISPRMKTISGSKFRSLLSWMSRHRTFCEQLGKSESFLLSMGSHAEALLPAANRHLPTGQLVEEDSDTPTGGKRLGRVAFAELVDEIEEKVRESQSGIPETTWTVEDTQERVAEVIGKVTDKVRVTMDCHLVGTNKVKIDKMSWWIGDYCYNPQDLIDIHHFRKIAKGVAVDGLGTDWRR